MRQTLKTRMRYLRATEGIVGQFNMFSVQGKMDLQQIPGLGRRRLHDEGGLERIWEVRIALRSLGDMAPRSEKKLLTYWKTTGKQVKGKTIQHPYSMS